ncbi:MAG: hypothetical protein ACKOZY_00210 [Flavobacteriales bacterium]
MTHGSTYRFCILAALLIIGDAPQSWAQQLDIPLNRFYTQEVERWILSDSTAPLHSGFKPYFIGQLNPLKIDGLVKDSMVIYSKPAGMLYKHHFAEWNFDDAWLAIDPVFDFTIGDDLSDITGYRTRTKYINQRGAQVLGNLGKKFSFQTAFYETQVMAPLYLKEIADSNDIYPGFGRTKPYAERGYDFAFAWSTLRYTPADWMSVELGNGKQFVGHGYRSLMWSDAMFSAPHLDVRLKSKNGKWQYVCGYSALQSLSRAARTNVPEAMFKRKGASRQYLSWKPKHWLELGLFDCTIIPLYDSLGTHAPALKHLIPVIGSQAIQRRSNPMLHHLFGLNWKFILPRRIELYGQWAIDDLKLNRSSWQIGTIAMDAFIPKLDFQFEWNHIASFFNTHENLLSSYTHANQPLGHPMGGGGDEWLGIVNYRHKRWFSQLKINYIVQTTGPGSDWRSDPSASEWQTFELVAIPNRQVLQLDAEAGYLFNTCTNFRVGIGYTHRTEQWTMNYMEDQPQRTDYLFFFIRTNLFNRYADF